MVESGVGWSDLSGPLEPGFIPCSVPNVQNLYSACSLRDVVENSVRSEHDLAQGTSRTPGISRTNERKGLENANVLKNPVSYPLRGSRIIRGDVGADVVKVLNGSFGPDYFEIHAEAQDSSSFSVSLWLLERPAAISARPRRMASMIRNSSEISSKVTFSGSL
jgi:hypothetical protein